MTTPPKLSRKEALVLQIMRDHQRGDSIGMQALFGLDLIAASAGRLKRGLIYVTLASMEERGLIVSRLGYVGGDGFPIDVPTRRHYWPAEAGLHALRRHAPTRKRRVFLTVSDLGEACTLDIADTLLASGTATWWDRRLHPFVGPDLRHLERAGLLVSREGEPVPERGGRPRFYYRLTEKGQAIVAGARWEDVR